MKDSLSVIEISSGNLSVATRASMNPRAKLRSHAQSQNSLRERERWIAKTKAPVPEHSPI